jgi:ribonuclease R
LKSELFPAQSNKIPLRGENKNTLMPKKRQPHQKTSRHNAGPRPRKSNLRYTSNLENDLIAFLYEAKAPVGLSEILKAVSDGRSRQTELKAVTEKLVQARIIKKIGKKHCELHPNAPIYQGTLDQNPRRFGFVTLTARRESQPALDQDVFVAAGHLGTALHGDTVLIRVFDVNRSGRHEGTVLKILRRGFSTLAGTYLKDRRGELVYPDDARYPFVIRVDGNNRPELKNGQMVIVAIHDADEQGHSLSGSITEILGFPDTIDVQMRLVIEKFKLPHVFSEAAQQEADLLAEQIAVDADRHDLRDVCHITIDGETAKDFDDAIAVEKIKSRYRLYVSIADVSHFVQAGSALDEDAYQRGTSVYFPGRVIPMLPEKLSNNLCSLIPFVDRLTLTAILDFDVSGKLLDSRFCRSIIRSRQRFTYTTVARILTDNTASEEHQPFLAMLGLAEQLAKALLKHREERGAIGFTLPEPEIALDDDGRIATIGRAVRNFAHQIIEEFMLAANEAVAATFTRQHRPGLYRIHELPDSQKVEEFYTFAKTLGLQLPAPQIRPDWFGQVLSLCKGSPKEYIVNNLLLRTMQQARYSPKNVGHFGLAATDYTHFTSPIRRYPDLMVHRELYRMFAMKQAPSISETGMQKLVEKGDFLSGRERTAVSAEREMNDRLKLIYMEKRMGESFAAIISGVNPSAFFVELLDLFISGSVAVEQLTGDHYFFDEKQHRLMGEIKRKTYQMGDLITVTLVDVDKRKNRINFKPSTL